MGRCSQRKGLGTKSRPCLEKPHPTTCQFVIRSRRVTFSNLSRRGTPWIFCCVPCDLMLYSHLESWSLVLSSLPQPCLNSLVSGARSLELHHRLYPPQCKLGIKHCHCVNTPLHHCYPQKMTVTVRSHHSEMRENNHEIWCLVRFAENQNHSDASSDYVLE